MTQADLDTGDVEVWPDNALAFNTFVSLGTQWRLGPAGPYGLDYAAMPGVLTMTGVDSALWADVFHDLRVMEDAALGQMQNDRDI